MSHPNWVRSASQNVLKMILKSPRFVLLEANLSQLGTNPDIPDLNVIEIMGLMRVCQDATGTDTIVFRLNGNEKSKAPSLFRLLVKA